jgi:ubiquinone/menaquinone biosynthesis C-methylase UbiE
MSSAPSPLLALAESPLPILEVTWAFASTQIVCTALELNLFTCIEEGFCTLEKLAGETGSSLRGLQFLLDALVGMRYLEKSGERYDLTPLSSQYLSQKSPSYLGGLVLHSRQLQANWSRLTGVVRTGRAPHTTETEEAQGEFFARFIDALHSQHSPVAATVARELWPDDAGEGRRVLEVGAGSAVWSLAFAHRDNRSQVTVADWPTVIERVTRKCVAREHAEERYDYLAGNYHDGDFGEATFDLGILGHICHAEGAARTEQLLARIHRALKPGGMVLIAEMIPDDKRRTAVYSLLFAVNMLVNTEEGETFTFDKYRQRLEDAGFLDVRTLQTSSSFRLIVANK